ncbi:DUF1768 domain-containing protein [Aphelenchoides fujianensis]|nr:DUF1768 domain-containing protein [Aphelenchoides fujianensis]
MTDPKVMKGKGKLIPNTSEWSKKQLQVMYEICRAKFEQNSHLRRQLLNTHRSRLVEANPHDRFWGVGLSRTDPRVHQPKKWRGRNHLGRILQRIRKELCQEANALQRLDRLAMDEEDPPTDSAADPPHPQLQPPLQQPQLPHAPAAPPATLQVPADMLYQMQQQLQRMEQQLQLQQAVQLQHATQQQPSAQPPVQVPQQPPAPTTPSVTFGDFLRAQPADYNPYSMTKVSNPQCAPLSLHILDHFGSRCLPRYLTLKYESITHSMTPTLYFVQYSTGPSAVANASPNPRTLQENLDKTSGLPQAQALALQFKLHSLPTLIWQNALTSDVSARQIGPSKCMLLTGKVVSHDMPFNFSHDQLNLFGSLPPQERFPSMILITVLPEHYSIRNKPGQPVLPLPSAYSQDSSPSLNRISRGSYLNALVYTLNEAVNFPRPGSLRDQIVYSSQ